MCGICGFTLPDPRTELYAAFLDPMLASLAHRGPDGQGRLVTPAVALGHRRLAIIDQAGGGQPMTGPGDVALVFNGEIYNYKEIRADLETRGVCFSTASDTEVFLKAYLEYGEACLESMVGMFAFVINDPRRMCIILGRDRLGKKPLYYWRGSEGIAFASEIKGLLPLPWVRRDLAVDPLAVRDYLSLGYILSPKSIYASIRKLPPGCLAVFSLAERTMTIRRWWDASQAFLAPKLPWNSRTVERFDELLTDSVALRLRSDVPVGAFLSGGLDSSAVTACMGKAGADVRLFNQSFTQESFDESPYAHAVARYLGLDITCVQQTLPGVEQLSKLVWHLDEPFCDTSIIPTFQLCQAARKIATVILGGDGADELLAGYVTHRADRVKRLTDLAPDFALNWVYSAARKIIRPSYKKVSWDYKAMQFLKGATLPARQAHYFWRTIFDANEVQNMLAPEYAKSTLGYDPYRSFARAFDTLPGQNFLDQSLYADMTTWLPDDILVKCDRMSMANSLELRSPFLDHRLVELAARLPYPAKMAGLEQKIILKRCMASRLPAGILARAKKGFNFPAYCISSTSLTPPRGTGVFRDDYRLDPTHTDVTYKSFNLLILATWYAIYAQFQSTGRWEPVPGNAA
jgi:asparagine synthase (glutamine-hydrolysing)